ncbi:GNAT family N-acetyltransferase [Massilia sp. CFBP9012]|uniref:GNAT family N-acetyltransferase n=1 Tax=Massilia sp. CFBP9012 TaxID=3096531 RepID=UPI002A6B0B7B|nr:GNAT family N-acetyltransferase [Massilia sp. CFBP9012]MDY0976296.1 GNAT family N-acetyltransferase [Massilia sp. CFBP9012]
MPIEVMPAFSIERAVVAERPLLFRLLQLYFFEATRWSGEDILDDGLYDCDEDGLQGYFDEQGVDAAYILRVDGKPAGFALVEWIPYEGGQIREFADLFVLPKYRRLGLAEATTRRVVLETEGPWLIAVFRKDEAALSHWQNAFVRLPFRSVRHGPKDDVFHQFIVNDTSAA